MRGHWALLIMVEISSSCDWSPAYGGGRGSKISQHWAKINILAYILFFSGDLHPKPGIGYMEWWFKWYRNILLETGPHSGPKCPQIGQKSKFYIECGMEINHFRLVPNMWGAPGGRA